MKLAIVVAHSSNRVIGRDGGLPWHLPGDMKHFRDLTVDHPVIMGRVTYDSIPEKFRPLSDRTNIVVSRDMTEVSDVCVCRSYPQALSRAKLSPGKTDRVFVIGGASIYQSALSYADEIYLTLIEDSVDGDTRFPFLAHDEWREVERTGLMFENDLEYRFIKLERVRS